MHARRPTRLTSKPYASAALGLALGVATLATTVPARAAEDETVPLDTKIFRSIMEGLGLKRDGESSINYQERGPLVIPPRLDLPPPEKADGVAAKDPAWPKDPDVSRRKAAAALERKRNISDEREREQNRLTEDQLTPGGRPTNPGRNRDAPNSEPGARSTPTELGAKSIWSKVFSKDEGDVARFTGEPPRTALTEPPPGYQTPSPDQPYGVGKAGPAKPEDFFTKRVEGEGSR